MYDFSDTENRAQYIEEERLMREENIRLQRKLQREVERREALCRQLSESESSLEMDDERYRDSDLKKKNNNNSKKKFKIIFPYFQLYS